ncbi:tRNA lysidine(34) synthetase TilS [Pyxidicoccus fallax]|uniref:tRNA(Ile)-lysidine synthase n=1 Tax=Pyxidicoccus fallax TaxID=394095 RepID=A0A848L831_9BACT|nr:tRNA lysidine(34) synthetase TilS [Pyxidicoccus fallax]NMO14402.1 tRNA lysidine(34) synthetase TilS [Pyxidicoccus fallax]NPC78752.1 tRNA lysidine(34) synthetase TilS [Pyxidicoccus fallax]
MPRTGPRTHLLTQTLEAAYARLGLRGGSVLLAVSGGADSTALLVGTARVAPRLRLRVEVATLNHGLRLESQAEVQAVVRLAGGLGLPCHVRELHLRPGAGVEARAREARYAALEALRRERGLMAVATAHTASDQAETLLMRLARGTALRGAGGIQEAREGLVRPLLERTRADVEAFLAEEGVTYSTDPMNADPALFRTRIRRDVLPAFSRAAGHAVETRLAAFARLAAEDDALLASLADEAWRRLRLEDGSLEAVGVRALEAPLRRRVLVRLLGEAGVPADEALLARVLRAVERGGVASLGRELQLRAASGRVRCVRREERPETRELRLDGPGAGGLLEGTGWRFSVEPGPPPLGVHGLVLAEGTRWPLTVRTRQPGDRLGTAAGQRKLQDVLVDLRVPAEKRAAWPVVVDGEGRVLWLPGLWSPPPPAVASGHALWAAPPGPSIQRTPSL